MDKNYFDIADGKTSMSQKEFLVPYDLPPKKYTQNGNYFNIFYLINDLLSKTKNIKMIHGLLNYFMLHFEHV